MPTAGFPIKQVCENNWQCAPDGCQSPNRTGSQGRVLDLPTWGLMDSRAQADLLQDLGLGIHKLRKPHKCLIFPASPGGQPKKEYLVPCFCSAEVLVEPPQPRIRQALSQQSEPFAAASLDDCRHQQPVQPALKATCAELFHQ